MIHDLRWPRGRRRLFAKQNNRRFESFPQIQHVANGGVQQLVAGLAHTQEVVGSSPTPATRRPTTRSHMAKKMKKTAKKGKSAKRGKC